MTLRNKLFLIILSTIYLFLSDVLFPSVLVANPKVAEIERRVNSRVEMLNKTLETLGSYVVGLGQVKMLRADTELEGVIPVMKHIMVFTPNAFAALDRNIYFTIPLLMSDRLTEEEMVGILCHEVSHLFFNHIANKLKQWELFIRGEGKTEKEFLSYLRENELQADLMGARLMLSLGRNPEAMKTGLAKICPASIEKMDETLLDHPHLDKRFEAINKGAKAGALKF